MKTTSSTAPKGSTYKGTDRDLFGFILGLLAFWLFAMTMLSTQDNISRDLGVDVSRLSFAVSITTLVSGLTIVLFGKLADKIGRVKFTRYGFYLAIAGAAVVAITPPNSSLTMPILILGRVLQGLSGACIMPATLALLTVYWDEQGRQRAVSLWSMGTWGGTSFATFVGTNIANIAPWGWRLNFVIATILSLVGLRLINGIPRSVAEVDGQKHTFDVAGMVIFMVSTLALMLLISYGEMWGIGNPITISLICIAILGFAVFIWVEKRKEEPFINLSLFTNGTFTGATISNFVLNGTAGVLAIAPLLMQQATETSNSTIGFLSVGYGVIIVLFIRVGEKLLQRFGPRKPMLWGCFILLAAILIMSPTNIMRETYMILLAVGYALFGLGLACYATPSTDAALSSLPPLETAGGSGIYKMASSLGAAFGLGLTNTIYLALSRDEEKLNFIQQIFIGDQTNVHFRQSAMIALLFNVAMILLAIVAIMITIPKGKNAKA